MQIRHFYTILLLLFAFQGVAQDSAYNTRALKYVSQYYDLAIKEQKRTGVPASITLAQGIVETDGGTSELMTKANNHFGIKCKNDWKGETFLHTDDKPNECFKKYRSSEDSYIDHSDHLLRNPRYAPLFKLKVSDYTAWAHGLKECGYATCTTYAEKLIKAIEDYKLQDYTLAALNNTDIKPTVAVAPSANDSEEEDSNTTPAIVATPKIDSPKTEVVHNTQVSNSAFNTVKKVADSAAAMFNKPVATKEAQAPINDATPVSITNKPKPLSTDTAEDTKYQYGRQITVNGLKAFYAHKGESMLPYAVQYNMRYAHLLELNDLSDAPLPCNMLVYTEKKLQAGTKPIHIVKENESLLQIAQKEGIQLKRLMAFNMLDDGEEPAVGVQLEMQSQASHKPDLRNINAAPPPENMSLEGLTASTNTPTGNFITTNNAQAKDSVATTLKQNVPKKEPEYASITPIPGGNNTKAIAKQEPTHTGNNAFVNKQGTANENTPPPITKDANFEYAGSNTPKKNNDDAKNDDLKALKEDMDRAVYAKDSGIKIASNFGNKVKKAEKPTHVVASSSSKSSSSNTDKFYKVQQGDTLSGIAHRNHLSLKQLLKWNADINPDALHLGQQIQIAQ